MKIRIAFCIIIFCLSLGCAHWVELQDLPQGTEDFLPSEVGTRIPAILKTIDLRINGSAIEPPEEFRMLVMQKLRRTYVFREVATLGESGMIKDRERGVYLGLSINGVADTNEMSNLVRFAANCATLFLLSSALPYKDQFDVTMMLKAVRPDGAERYYRSRIQGAAYYRFFGGEQARTEAQDEVVTRGLNALMRQLMKDVDFFAVQTTQQRQPMRG